jgi:nicotinamidase-related amidase
MKLKNCKKVFIDVDTIKDFFKGGSLEVPNTSIILPVLKKINELAISDNIPVLKFNDLHDGTEPEMIQQGGPFPFHAIEGTPGAEGIFETRNKKAIIFPKKTYDAFDKKLGNQNIEKWLIDNNVTTAYVYGVATEYCILAAVLGLRKLGITTYVFENAIQHIDEESGKVAKQKMRDVGAHFAVAKL